MDDRSIQMPSVLLRICQGKDGEGSNNAIKNTSHFQVSYHLVTSVWQMDDDILKLYQQNIYMNRTILLLVILIAASAVKIDNYLQVDPQQCIEEKCPNQYAECQKDPKCLPALEDCQKKCGTKSSCWTFCLPGKGSQAAIDTAKCASKNGCVGSVPEETRLVLAVLNTPEECVMDHCKDQLFACYQDSKCLPALQDCEKECNDNIACWNTCVPKKGSTTAANYWKCIIDNDCINAVQKILKSTAVVLADPQQCIEEKCPSQWAACQKDSKCVAALEDCQKKCGTKASCWTLCLPGKGSQAAIDVAKCAQAQGCDKAKQTSTAVAVADPQQCIQEKCPNQYAECQKDPKCLPALQDCQKKCGTKSSCWTFCLPGKGSQAAIDTAKCASKNGCVGATPFESCMSRSCSSEHEACLDNWSCRKSLRKCLTGNAIFDFEHECLLAESKVIGFLSEWYHCAGNHFCI